MSRRYDPAAARVQHTHVHGGSPQASSYKVIFKGINRSKRHAYTLAQIFGLIPPNPVYDLEHVTGHQSNLRALSSFVSTVDCLTLSSRKPLNVGATLLYKPLPVLILSVSLVLGLDIISSVLLNK